MLSRILSEGRNEDDQVLHFFHNIKLAYLQWSKLYLLGKPVPFADSPIDNYTVGQTLGLSTLPLNTCTPTQKHFPFYQNSASAAVKATKDQYEYIDLPLEVYT